MNHTTRKITLAAESAIAKFADVLEMIDGDMKDAEHMTQDARSRVIQGGIHNAAEYLHRDFLNVLDDARDALERYRKTLDEYVDTPPGEGSITSRLYTVASQIHRLTSSGAARERGIACSEVRNIAAQIETIADDAQKQEPRKCWVAVTTDTNESDPEYTSVVSLFSSREAAVACVESAIAEDTAEGGNWEPSDVRWNDSRTICEYSGGSVIHRISEIVIQ